MPNQSSNPKPFLSYEQQLNKLQLEKNLTIDDVDYALDMLERVGYYALISGYKNLYRNKTIGKYRDGTRFEDIVALFRFDERLRELFLRYLLHIERHIRSLISYYFTATHGESQTAYLSACNYDPSDKAKDDIAKLINVLSNKAVHSKDCEYINYQRTKYSNVPLWVLVNVLTFGNISNMYSCLTQSMRSKICKNFDLVNENEMSKFLQVLTKYRNVCAHSERLFSYRVKELIPDTIFHKKLNVSKKGTVYANGKSDLFAVVIIFKLLLPRDDFKRFKSDLSLIISGFLNQTSQIAENELLRHMGFPENWKNITRYQG